MSLLTRKLQLTFPLWPATARGTFLLQQVQRSLEISHSSPHRGIPAGLDDKQVLLLWSSAIIQGNRFLSQPSHEFQHHCILQNIVHSCVNVQLCPVQQTIHWRTSSICWAQPTLCSIKTYSLSVVGPWCNQGTLRHYTAVRLWLAGGHEIYKAATWGKLWRLCYNSHLSPDDAQKMVESRKTH